jgi:ElaB/YqjD/DUF883 family membrane-anchored ribosome-binding protein
MTRDRLEKSAERDLTRAEMLERQAQFYAEAAEKLREQAEEKLKSVKEKNENTSSLQS